MHQLGHSRAQIMHDVQAGSISLIVPCPAARRRLDHGERRRTRPPTVAAATSSGSASGASGARSPQTARSGTPGGTIRRRLGDAARSRPVPSRPARSAPVRAASTSSLRIGVPSKSAGSRSRRRSPPTNSTPNSSATSRSCHAAPAKRSRMLSSRGAVARKLGADQQRAPRPSPGCAAPPAPAVRRGRSRPRTRATRRTCSRPPERPDDRRATPAGVHGDHDATRPVNWSSTARSASGGGGHPGT